MNKKQYLFNLFIFLLVLFSIFRNAKKPKYQIVKCGTNRAAVINVQTGEVWQTIHKENTTILTPIIYCPPSPDIFDILAAENVLKKEYSKKTSSFWHRLKFFLQNKLPHSKALHIACQISTNHKP